jgi:hypothetical protein
MYKKIYPPQISQGESTTQPAAAFLRLYRLFLPNKGPNATSYNPSPKGPGIYCALKKAPSIATFFKGF